MSPMGFPLLLPFYPQLFVHQFNHFFSLWVKCQVPAPFVLALCNFLSHFNPNHRPYSYQPSFKNLSFKKGRGTFSPLGIHLDRYHWHFTGQRFSAIYWESTTKSKFLQSFTHYPWYLFRNRKWILAPLYSSVSLKAL